MQSSDVFGTHLVDSITLPEQTQNLLFGALIGTAIGVFRERGTRRRRQGCPKKLPLHLTDEGDGKAATGGEPMRDLKEAGVQTRHLSESEPLLRRGGLGEVPWITEAR